MLRVSSEELDVAIELLAPTPDNERIFSFRARWTDWHGCAPANCGFAPGGRRLPKRMGHRSIAISDLAMLELMHFYYNNPVCRM